MQRIIEIKHLNLDRLAEMESNCISQGLITEKDSRHHLSVACFLKSLSFKKFIEFGYGKRITANLLTHYLGFNSILASNHDPRAYKKHVFNHETLFVGCSQSKEFMKLLKPPYSLALITHKPLDTTIEELTLAREVTSPNAAILLEYNQNKYEIKELIDKHSKNIKIIANFEDNLKGEGVFVCKKIAPEDLNQN